jgi:hypothetical protein
LVGAVDDAIEELGVLVGFPELLEAAGGLDRKSVV